MPVPHRGKTYDGTALMSEGPGGTVEVIYNPEDPEDHFAVARAGAFNPAPYAWAAGIVVLLAVVASLILSPFKSRGFSGVVAVLTAVVAVALGGAATLL
jgi:hypothetical protein